MPQYPAQLRPGPAIGLLVGAAVEPTVGAAVGSVEAAVGASVSAAVGSVGAAVGTVGSAEVGEKVVAEAPLAAGAAAALSLKTHAQLDSTAAAVVHAERQMAASGAKSRTDGENSRHSHTRPSGQSSSSTQTAASAEADTAAAMANADLMKECITCTHGRFEFSLLSNRQIGVPGNVHAIKRVRGAAGAVEKKRRVYLTKISTEQSRRAI